MSNAIVTPAALVAVINAAIATLTGSWLKAIKAIKASKATTEEMAEKDWQAAVQLIKVSDETIAKASNVLTLLDSLSVVGTFDDGQDWTTVQNARESLVDAIKIAKADRSQPVSTIAADDSSKVWAKAVPFANHWGILSSSDKDGKGFSAEGKGRHNAALMAIAKDLDYTIKDDDRAKVLEAVAASGKLRMVAKK